MKGDVTSNKRLIHALKFTAELHGRSASALARTRGCLRRVPASKGFFFSFGTGIMLVKTFRQKFRKGDERKAQILRFLKLFVNVLLT